MKSVFIFQFFFSSVNNGLETTVHIYQIIIILNIFKIWGFLYHKMTTFFTTMVINFSSATYYTKEISLCMLYEKIASKTKKKHCIAKILRMPKHNVGNNAWAFGRDAPCGITEWVALPVDNGTRDGGSVGRGRSPDDVVARSNAYT